MAAEANGSDGTFDYDFFCVPIFGCAVSGDLAVANFNLGIAETLSGGIGKGSVSGICFLARAGKGGYRSLALRRRLINLLLELSRLGLQPFHRVGRIAAKAFLARDVFAHLRLPRDHALYGITNPRLFAVELVTTDGKALKFRGAGDLCFPQFRQGGSLFGTCGGTGCCGLGAFRGERACGAKGIVAFGKR